MGSLAARDMAAHAGQDVALEWHVMHNHYPPPPRSMIAVCRLALAAIQEEEPGRIIPLPDGANYRGQGPQAPASAIAENFHLYDLLGDCDREDAE